VRVVDLEKIAALARKHGLISMIDSTIATPINCRPTEWGIDIVLHSGTKYFGGHSDIMCGVAAGRSDLLEQIHHARNTLGGCMDPHAAFLLLRGIKTLAVRVERQNESALRIAEFLSRHPKVARVHYPMLKKHPDHTIAKKQMAGGGGLLSFEVEGSGADACRVAEALNLFTLAPSLGGVDSLVTIPVLTSHYLIDPEVLKKMGVTEQMIRLSVGVEHVEDLIADLEKGLAVLSRERVRVGAAD
jgi:cystathionine beta-lyase/cystathionine gamma-synthase